MGYPSYQKPDIRKVPIVAPVVDARGKEIKVGDTVGFTIDTRYPSSTTPGVSKIKSIELFEDFNMDYQNSRWVPFLRYEVRFEELDYKRLKRSAGNILKLEQ